MWAFSNGRADKLHGLSRQQNPFHEPTLLRPASPAALAWWAGWDSIEIKGVGSAQPMPAPDRE
jgi:hypothetical protein